MTKQMPPKKLMIMIGAAVAAIAVAITVFIAFRASGEESYRSVMVYELEGSAVIERADIGTIDAAENLYLESGDRVQVGADSMMRLKLDSDKYVTAEENTVFVLTAKGNEQDSETRIDLEQGAITNEIQNPLSERSVYETATPNAVMAVRGTIYRAELCEDGEGNLVTKLCCFEGAVRLAPVGAEESYEPVTVEAGNEASVIGIDVPVSEVIPIVYDNLPPQAVEILQKLHIETGTADESAADGGALDQAQTMSQTDGSRTSQDTASAQENPDQGKDTGAEKDGGTAQKDNGTGKDTAQTRENSGRAVRTGDNGGQVQAADEKDSRPKPDAGKSSDDGSSAEQDTDNGSNDTAQSDPGNGGQGSNKPKPSKAKEYTVTFQYHNETFATQKVKAGGKASEPVLKPAQDGKWDFDFDTKINKNTTISWKQ